MRPKYNTPIETSLHQATEPQFGKICYRLRTRDKKIGKIIDSIGPCLLKASNADFSFLVNTIINQQLSIKATKSIAERFRQLFPLQQVTASTFLEFSKESIMNVGISARKYEYITDLASKVMTGDINLDTLQNESESVIRETLISVKGIGDWTITMYLLFGLARLDIFPVHDLSLRKVMSAVYGVDKDNLAGLKRISAQWKPYRSIGTWYLYRYI